MSPFVSEKQKRFLYAKHPEIAKKWSGKYESSKNLPEKLSEKAKRLRKRIKQCYNGNKGQNLSNVLNQGQNLVKKCKNYGRRCKS